MTVLDMTLTAITAPGANAGHDVPMPFWQDRPCPSWCAMTVPHEDHALYDDRMHMSVLHEVVLTLEPQPADEFGPGGPANLVAGLWQHYREREPYIVLIVNGRRDIKFTLGEAGQLAAALEDAALQAAKFWEARPEPGRPYWQSLPCPGWCTGGHADEDDPGSRVHLSDYRMLILTMEDPAVSVKPGPAGELLKAEITTQQRSIGIRLSQGWREYEARVSIVVHDDYLDLTLTEAGELTDVLAGLVLQAGHPDWLSTVDGAQ